MNDKSYESRDYLRKKDSEKTSDSNYDRHTKDSDYYKDRRTDSRSNEHYAKDD